MEVFLIHENLAKNLKYSETIQLAYFLFEVFD